MLLYISSVRGGGYFLHKRAFSLWGIYATIKRKPYGIDKIKNILYYANNKMTRENSIKVGELLMRFKPVQYEGYARSFVELGRILTSEKRKIWSPKSIFCYGDCLTEEMRKELSKTFNTNVYDFYSHVENVVVIGELYPAERYIMEDYFYPELLSINQDQEELVGTSFFNYAMPLIRYKTGDIIEVHKDSIDNNIAFTKVKSIIGRENDYIVMQDGRKILSVQRAIYGYNKIVATQIVQNTYTDLLVKLIVDEGFDDDTFKDIAKKINIVCGCEMNITFNIVKQLDKTKSGKSPFIIRKVNE